MAETYSLLDLLLEMQMLDRMPRTGYAMRGVAQPESVSEHTFHVVFLVWLLARREPEIDLARALQLALVHDLGEVRLGDLPRPAAHYLPAGAKHLAERRAVDELLAPADGDDGLLAEYQAASSREARFVGACDKLQLWIKATLYRQQGHLAIDELLSTMSGSASDEHGLTGGEFASIDALVGDLLSRRSRP